MQHNLFKVRMKFYAILLAALATIVAAAPVAEPAAAAEAAPEANPQTCTCYKGTLTCCNTFNGGCTYSKC
jgi:uncharacterized membrane protein